MRHDLCYPFFVYCESVAVQNRGVRICMGKSREFDRDGDPDVKKVVTETGPLGMVPILYIIVAALVLIGMVLWWRG